MCVSINKSVVSDNSINSVAQKNLRNEPLNLNLPQEFHKELKNDQIDIASTNKANYSTDPFNQPQKRIHYPNVPVYNDPNEKLRLTEYSPNSAKIEYGNPGEKPLITIRARNEETYTHFNGMVQTDSKISIKSPYLESKVKDYAKDTVMDNVVTPLRETIGKTAADTTLGVAVVATALVSAKHLPDGNVKIDIPTKSITGSDTLKTRLIMGYGDGENLKATGVEIKNRFDYKDQNLDVKLSYRKDAEVNNFKDVTKTELEATLVDKNPKWDSGTLGVRIGHDKVNGTSAGLFYHKQF